LNQALAHYHCDAIMYFRKSTQSSPYQEEGCFHALLIKRELYLNLHANNLAWVRDTVSSLEHDLLLHSAARGSPTECAHSCEAKQSPPELHIPETTDGRPHRLETCQLELEAFRSLEAELVAETGRILTISLQKSSLLQEWTKHGVVPSVFT
jgi:hypothetical protein